MKCLYCEGTGNVFVKTSQNPITGRGYKRKCHFCNGSGEMKLTHIEYMQKGDLEQLGCFICAQFMNGACGECKFMKPVDGRHTCGLRDWLREEYKEL